MPHLQFEVSESLDKSEIESFVDWVTSCYSDLMETGTGHIGVTVRDGATLALGRADADEPVAFLNADIRDGRSFEQRRNLAVTIMNELNDRWNIPIENIYVIYTEHSGEDFHLQEGALTSWAAEEETDETSPL